METDAGEEGDAAGEPGRVTAVSTGAEVGTAADLENMEA